MALRRLRRKVGAELRLPARPLEEHHQLARHPQRDHAAEILLDQRQRQVQPRGHAGGRVHVAILDVDAVRLYLDARKHVRQAVGGVPVRGDAASVQQARMCKHHRAGADRPDPPHRACLPGQPCADGFILRLLP
ncbi:hypothetical protein D3C81_1199520 [compost metagenome]